MSPNRRRLAGRIADDRVEEDDAIGILDVDDSGKDEDVERRSLVGARRLSMSGAKGASDGSVERLPSMKRSS